MRLKNDYHFLREFGETLRLQWSIPVYAAPRTVHEKIEYPGTCESVMLQEIIRAPGMMYHLRMSLRDITPTYI
jgi:hypothetical protein